MLAIYWLLVKHKKRTVVTPSSERKRYYVSIQTWIVLASLVEGFVVVLVAFVVKDDVLTFCWVILGAGGVVAGECQMKYSATISPMMIVAAIIRVYVRFCEDVEGRGVEPPGANGLLVPASGVVCCCEI
jgi:hypothetical protein